MCVTLYVWRQVRTSCTGWCLRLKHRWLRTLLLHSYPSHAVTLSCVLDPFWSGQTSWSKQMPMWKRIMKNRRKGQSQQKCVFVCLVWRAITSGLWPVGSRLWHWPSGGYKEVGWGGAWSDRQPMRGGVQLNLWLPNEKEWPCPMPLPPHLLPQQ